MNDYKKIFSGYATGYAGYLKIGFNADLIFLFSRLQILEDLLCAVSTIYSQSEEAGNNKGNWELFTYDLLITIKRLSKLKIGVRFYDWLRSNGRLFIMAASKP